MLDLQITINQLQQYKYSNDGTPYNGIIIRLNHKTATVNLTNGNGEWRVSYRCLSKLIDSKANYIAGELL